MVWHRDRGWGLGTSGRYRATRVCIVCSSNDTSKYILIMYTHPNTPSLNSTSLFLILQLFNISKFKLRAKSKGDIFHDVIVWWRHMFEKSHFLKGGTFFDPTRCWYIMRVFAETHFRAQKFVPLGQSSVRCAALRISTAPLLEGGVNVWTKSSKNGNFGRFEMIFFLKNITESRRKRFFHSFFPLVSTKRRKMPVPLFFRILSRLSLWER